jgi:hypothetical protein
VTTDRNDLLDDVTDAVRQAVASQRMTHPDHEQFYAWGYALSEITHQLKHVSRILATQVKHYGDERVLRDDAGADPKDRLHVMEAELRVLATTLAEAERIARRYHSEASHIAVAIDPNADVSNS